MFVKEYGFRCAHTAKWSSISCWDKSTNHFYATSLLIGRSEYSYVAVVTFLLFIGKQKHANLLLQLGGSMDLKINVSTSGVFSFSLATNILINIQCYSTMAFPDFQFVFIVNSFVPWFAFNLLADVCMKIHCRWSDKAQLILKWK